MSATIPTADSTPAFQQPWEPRIPLDVADTPDAEAQEAFARFQTSAGPLNNGVRQLALYPAAIDLATGLSALHKHASGLEPRLIEAARLRAAAAAGCAYCVGWHRRFAIRNGGYSKDQAAQILDVADTTLTGLDDDTRLVVRFSHELSTATVSDATWDAAVARFGLATATALTAICAAQNASSRIFATLHAPFEPAYERMMAREAQPPPGPP